jgi:hypothetical protein
MPEWEKHRAKHRQSGPATCNGQHWEQDLIARLRRHGYQS